MSQFTPGPWEAKQDGDDGYWFVQVAVQPKSCHPMFDRYRIIHGWVGGDGTNNPKPELGTPEANARLIAAAPDLLEALVDLVGDAYAHGVPFDHGHPVRRIVSRAEAAIAKAVQP